MEARFLMWTCGVTSCTDVSHHIDDSTKRRPIESSPRGVDDDIDSVHVPREVTFETIQRANLASARAELTFETTQRAHLASARAELTFETPQRDSVELKMTDTANNDAYPSSARADLNVETADIVQTYNEVVNVRPASALAHWLKERSLGRYLDALHALGVKRLSDLAYITDADLDDVGMSLIDKLHFQLTVVS